MSANPQPIEEEKWWDIYLCCCEQDKKFAEWLGDELQKKGLSVWSGRAEILIGDSIIEEKTKGLQGSTLFLVVLSKQALTDDWVMNEINTRLSFRYKDKKRQKTVLPILIGRFDSDKLENHAFLNVYKSIFFPKSGARQNEAFNKLVDDIQARLNRSGISPVPPLRKYPFGSPDAVPPSDFIIDEDLIQRITDDIKNKRSVSIIGLPGMGKTALLDFLMSSRYEDSYVKNSSGLRLKIASHNFGKGRYDKSDELMLKLAKAIAESLTEKERFDFSDGKSPYKWIETVINSSDANNPRWVLLLDNFDPMIQFIEDESGRAVFDNLHTLRKTHNICFIIASCQRLWDWSRSSDTSEFFRINEYPLGLWKQDTAKKLMEELDVYSQEAGWFNGFDYKFLFRLTAYHPFLLQKGCKYLLEAHQRKEIMGIKSEIYEEYERNLIGIFVRNYYVQDCLRIYHDYWKRQINDEEQNWIIKCCNALSLPGERGRRELMLLSLLQSKHVLDKLKRMGFVLKKPEDTAVSILDTPEMIDIPLGIRIYLFKEEKISYI